MATLANLPDLIIKQPKEYPEHSRELLPPMKEGQGTDSGYISPGGISHPDCQECGGHTYGNSNLCRCTSLAPETKKFPAKSKVEYEVKYYYLLKLLSRVISSDQKDGGLSETTRALIEKDILKSLQEEGW